MKGAKRFELNYHIDPVAGRKALSSDQQTQTAFSHIVRDQLRRMGFPTDENKDCDDEGTVPRRIAGAEMSSHGVLDPSRDSPTWSQDALALQHSVTPRPPHTSPETELQLLGYCTSQTRHQRHRTNPRPSRAKKKCPLLVFTPTAST